MSPLHPEALRLPKARPCLSLVSGTELILPVLIRSDWSTGPGSNPGLGYGIAAGFYEGLATFACKASGA